MDAVGAGALHVVGLEHRLGFQLGHGRVLPLALLALLSPLLGHPRLAHPAGETLRHETKPGQVTGGTWRLLLGLAWLLSGRGCLAVLAYSGNSALLECVPCRT